MVIFSCAGSLKIRQDGFLVENEQLATRQITIKTPTLKTADAELKREYCLKVFTQSKYRDPRSLFFESPRDISIHPPPKTGNGKTSRGFMVSDVARFSEALFGFRNQSHKMNVTFALRQAWGKISVRLKNRGLKYKESNRIRFLPCFHFHRFQ
jgi:hypothetical protein